MFVDPCIIVKFIKKNSTRCNNALKFYYSLFIWSSAFFGRHTAHHQEPKTSLAASGFSYVQGCWTCSWWTLSDTVCAWQRPPTTSLTTFHVWKTRGCQCSFRLLVMGGVSSETCWASYEYGIIKFWYIIASCWTFLYDIASHSCIVIGRYCVSCFTLLNDSLYDKKIYINYKFKDVSLSALCTRKFTFRLALLYIEGPNK